MGPRACKLGLGSLASQHLDSPGKSTISSLGFHSVTLFLYFDGTDVFICSGSKGWRTVRKRPHAGALATGASCSAPGRELIQSPENK